MRRQHHPAFAPRYDRLFDPGTIAIVSAISAAAGTAVSAGGVIAQGQARAAASRQNAAVAEAEANRAEQVAAFEAGRVRDRVRRLLSSQRAAAGGQGLGALTGSPLLALAESAGEAEIEARLIEQSGTVNAARSRGAAALNRLDARASIFGGFVDAGATLLGGGARAGGAFLDAKALKMDE